MKPTHEPVMLEECLELLDIRVGGTAVDGTLGLAGHARRMCDALGAEGLFLGMDWDAEMLEIAKENLAGAAPKVELVQSDYRELPQVLRAICDRNDRAPQADAILIDFGVCSAHFDDASRGFSFRNDAPLDMRMDRSKGPTAAELLSESSLQEIERVLREYGDERWSKRIAEVICDRRPIATTKDLVDCVMAAIPASMRESRIHPATRTFMALRVWTNSELENLEESLRDMARTLAPNGRFVVLTYHSGEDRAAKRAFRDLAKTEDFEDLTRHPVRPKPEEVASNPKSRSAKLRALSRTGDTIL